MRVQRRNWEWVAHSREEYEAQIQRDFPLAYRPVAQQNHRVEPALRIPAWPHPVHVEPIFEPIPVAEPSRPQRRFRSANVASPSIEEAIQILQGVEYSIFRAQIMQMPLRYIILYARDRAICQLCQEICEPNVASLDHIIPRRYQGRSVIGNLQLAHRLCNNQCCRRPECPHEVYKCGKQFTVIQFDHKPNTRLVYCFGNGRLAA